MKGFEKDLLEDLCREVDSRQDRLIELAQRLIGFPNVSPPGRNSAEAQAFVQDYLESIGCSIDRWEAFPGDPNIIAVMPGTSPEQYKSLILNAHIDVAEVGDTSAWSFDPFKAFVRDGRLYGRGASDMKTALAAFMFAMKIIREKNVELKGNLILHSVTGEEAGEGITFQAAERGPSGDFAVAGDISDFKLQNGQGGVITGWITVQSPKTYHDGIRSKMIHAGGGLFAASAVEKMAKIIQGLGELERHWAVTKSYPGFAPGSNTINPAVIEGGRHAAFVADKCALWITVHFYPDENYETVAREIEEHILNVAKADPWLKENPPHFTWGGKSMLVDRGEIFPSLELGKDHPGLKMLEELHTEVVGEKPVVDMCPTVTDAGWLARAGIPTVIYGPGELDLAHGVDESISVKDFVDYTKVILSFICRWCNTPRE
ncbi:MAG TPA: acetylornithine deacetylase [Clostridia bacterium]|jgi:acetylornithine deacetylase/succinyl-diaminopimelate desuccinylase family protein|nr:acetylornithine deacetylase [Clostridia bacterium]